MAEGQLAHGQAMERGKLRAETWVRILSASFAFVIAISGIGGGVYLISQGRDVGGLVLILGELGLLASAFIADRRRKPQKRN